MDKWKILNMDTGRYQMEDLGDLGGEHKDRYEECNGE